MVAKILLLLCLFPSLGWAQGLPPVRQQYNGGAAAVTFMENILTPLNGSCTGITCTIGLANDITFGATDMLDLSAIDANAAAEGLILPQTTACAGSGQASGSICYGTTSDEICVWDGSAWDCALLRTPPTISTLVLFDINVALSVSNDIPSIMPNRGSAFTVTEVCCEVDAGTTTVNLQRDDGTPANILSADLTCNTDLNSGCTTTFSGSEASIANTNKVDFLLVTNGSAKRINVAIKTTTP